MRKLGLGLMALLAAGCVSTGRGPAAWTPTAIPHAAARPRALVYGDLLKLLPHHHKTSAMEQFLYGPGEHGDTILRNPQGLALAGRRLLVCDQGLPDLVAIDLDSGKTSLWGDEEHRPRCPVDVAVGPDGRVFIADTTRRAVLIYRQDESFDTELVQPDEGQQGFVPCAVLVHEEILYVGDRGRRRLDRFDLNRGEWLPSFAPSDEALTLIAPTGLAAAHDGTILIADAVRGDISRVSVDGKWLAPIGRPGREAGQFVRPKQVRVTPSGLILVTDAGRQSVLVFDSRGVPAFEIHEQAGGWEGWTLPAGLAVLGPGELVNAPQDAEAYVVVTDTMGGVSLTVIGIVAAEGVR